MIGGLLRRARRAASRPLVAWFLAAGPLLLLGDAVSSWTLSRFGVGRTILLAVALIAIVVLVVDPVRVLANTLQRRLSPSVEVDERGGVVPSHRGLIVFASVGVGISSAEGSIRHHLSGGRLEHCWIISAGDASTGAARTLGARLVQEGFPAESLHLRSLAAEDADNPEAVYACVEAVYREARNYGLDDPELMADYTGGTKSMTAGMILACVSPDRHLQFMKPRKYSGDGRADLEAGSDPRAVDVRFELIPRNR